ncbi:MAG: Crp/Fnr family transcriptional regulator [Fluviicola sp.]|nr:Crp/Fnr family transcriptional regulator [Fluviicola sp.]
MRSFTEILTEATKNNSPKLAELTASVQILSIKKGTLLQKQGDINSNLYFVKKGMLRSYIIDEKGKEHIFMFAPEGWLIADGSLDNTNELFIDALENTEVEVVSQKDFYELFLPLASVNDTDRAEGMLRRMSVMQKRIIMLISASAIERYEHFMKTYPDVIQRVPQKMIASYLGITPEALSKVKGMRFK